MSSLDMLSNNFSRLSRLNDKLNIVSSKIDKEKNSKYQFLHEKVNDIENRLQDSIATFQSKYTDVKESIETLMVQLSILQEKDEVYINDKTHILASFEQKVNIRMQQEAETREILETKMSTIIEDKYNYLKMQISNEGRTRYEAIEEMKSHLEGDVPKLSATAKYAISKRKEKDEEIKKQINIETKAIHNNIVNEKKMREENDEGFVQAVKLSLAKFKEDVVKERNQRETAVDSLVSLLEDTCNKIDQNNFF